MRVTNCRCANSNGIPSQDFLTKKLPPPLLAYVRTEQRCCLPLKYDFFFNFFQKDGFCKVFPFLCTIVNDSNLWLGFSVCITHGVTFLVVGFFFYKVELTFFIGLFLGIFIKQKKLLISKNRPFWAIVPIFIWRGLWNMDAISIFNMRCIVWSWPSAI